MVVPNVRRKRERKLSAVSYRLSEGRFAARADGWQWLSGRLPAHVGRKWGKEGRFAARADGSLMADS